jgi:hypothetical protein
MSANAYATLVAATATNTVPNNVDFNAAVKVVSWQIVPTGTIAGGAVTLEVSLDGTTWSAPPTATAVSLSGATAANPYTLVTGTNALFTITNAAVRYARARVSTAVTGGGSVTVLVSGI